MVNLVVTSLVFSLIGIALFGLAFFIIVKVSPFSTRKEIEEDQNTALAILIGSVIIGILPPVRYGLRIINQKMLAKRSVERVKFWRFYLVK